MMMMMTTTTTTTEIRTSAAVDVRDDGSKLPIELHRHAVGGRNSLGAVTGHDSAATGQVLAGADVRRRRPRHDARPSSSSAIGRRRVLLRRRLRGLGRLQ